MNRKFVAQIIAIIVAACAAAQCQYILPPADTASVANRALLSSALSSIVLPSAANCAPVALLATETPASIAENGTATFSVRLAEDPQCTTALQVEATNNTAGGGASIASQPAEIAFTSENFSTAQTVTLTAADDNDILTDSLSVRVFDPFGNIASASFDLTVTEDDKYLFVTRALYSADLQSAGGGANGIAGADNICAAEKANYPGLPGVGTDYKALLTDGDVRDPCSAAGCTGVGDPRQPWVLLPNTGYHQAEAGNARVGTTNDKAIFRDGSSVTIVAPFTSDASIQGYTFSGFNTDWTNSSTCDKWRSDSIITGVGIRGDSGKDGSEAIFSLDVVTCDQTSRLVCVQQ